MDRFTRILLLHRILASARRPVSRNAIQEQLECSAASVKRIIAEMRDFLDAPVEYDRSANGYYYNNSGDRPFELPGLWFSGNELLALASMQTLLAGLGPGLLDNSLRPFKHRLEQLLKNEATGLVELPRRIRLSALAGRTPEASTFQRIAAATLQRRRVKAFYRGRGKDKIEPRELSPQRLILYRHNWYLDAWCHGREALRTFALERLTEVRQLDTSADDVAEADLDAHFASGYGIFAGRATATAVLRFEPVAARWVSDELWHPEQQSEWLPDGRYELRLPYAASTELAMDILRYGPDVEVIAPNELKMLVQKRLRAALARYDAGSVFEPPGVVEQTVKQP